MTTVEVEDREPLRVEVEQFLEAIQSGSPPAATGRVGTETIELLEHLFVADAGNRVVDPQERSEKISQ